MLFNLDLSVFFMLLILSAHPSVMSFSSFWSALGGFDGSHSFFLSLSLIKVFLHFYSSPQWLKNVSSCSTSCFNLSYFKMSSLSLFVQACSKWLSPEGSALLLTTEWLNSVRTGKLIFTETNVNNSTAWVTGSSFWFFMNNQDHFNWMSLMSIKLWYSYYIFNLRQ